MPKIKTGLLVQGAMRNARGASKGTKETSFPSACYFDIIVSMPKQETLISKKRRGPVPKEPTIPLLVRCSPALVDRLDAWIDKQADPLTRPAAIRRLLERALKR